MRFLDSSFILAFACDTSNFDQLSLDLPVCDNSDGYLYAPMVLRRGGLGFIGGVAGGRTSDGITQSSGFGEDSLLYLMRDNNLGNLLYDVYYSDPTGAASTLYHHLQYLGDPTLDYDAMSYNPIFMVTRYHDGLYNRPNDNVHPSWRFCSTDTDSLSLYFTKVDYTDEGIARVGSATMTVKEIEGDQITDVGSVSDLECEAVNNYGQLNVAVGEHARCDFDFEDLDTGDYTCSLAIYDENYYPYIPGVMETIDCPFWFKVGGGSN